MSVSTPWLVAIIVACLGSGGVITVGINSIATALTGKEGRRADAASKLTESYDRLTNRLEKELEELDAVKERCNKCEARVFVTERRMHESEQRERDTSDELKKLKAAMRVLVRVYDEHDPTSIAEAIEATKQLI